MSAAKIKKGDRVVVLSGKDKGKHGEVTKSFPKDGKVIVAGVNIATRHKKPTQANPQGVWSVAKRRCRCRRSQSKIRSRASQRASASKSRTARRSAWP